MAWIISSVCLCVLCVGAWVYFSRANTKALIFGGLAILSIAPVAGTVGFFISAEHANSCYSEALKTIGEMAISAISSNDKNQAAQFVNMTQKFPLQGYETNCLAVYKVMLSYSNDPNLRHYGLQIRP